MMGWHSDMDFNPRTPRGVRLEDNAIDEAIKEFQSTHPARGATLSPALAVIVGKFQSTHPARGATYEQLMEDEED